MSTRTLLNALNTVSAYDHCRVLLPWFSYARGDRPLARLRRAALQVGRPDAIQPGLALVILAACVHPLRVLRETILSMRRLGRACKSVYGVGILRQFFGALYCGLRHNLGPEHYFFFRLHDRPLADWAEFISHEECTRLLLRLRAESTGDGQRDIWSKQGWRRFCERQAIPTVPIWATAGAEGVSFLKGKALLRGKDLFLKPDDDYSGRGGVLLSWEQEQEGWRADGALTDFIPAENIETFLKNAGETATQVLQQRLRNSPSLEGFSQRALVNARVLTCRDSTGHVSLICASLRSPPGDQMTSDVPGKTIIIPIDVGTGMLGCIHGPDILLSGGEYLPGKGQRVKGVPFPDWDKACALVRHAHTCVNWLPCVGWDLVSTDQGLMLLEGNVVWNARLGQQYGLCPLGTTELPAALDAHLSRSAVRAGANGGNLAATNSLPP